MKITHTHNALQFKGFSNVVSNTFAEGDGISLSYMAMKLDNNEKPDLDTWKDIQRKLFKMDKTSDCIIFHCISRDNTDVFSLSDRSLNLHDALNPQDEKLMLKAYSLIASITKRLVLKDNPPEDAKLCLTVAELLKNLTQIIENKSIALTLTTQAAMKKVEHYKTANLINSLIDKNMKNYFRL